MATGAAKTTSVSTTTATVNPSVRTSAISTTQAKSAKGFGNFATVAGAKSEFQADSGDLANGRYRR